MNPIVVIPARMAATRLPGKPLADIGGRPMILRVLDQALAADVGPVAVAAGDPEIVETVRQAGGQAVLTDPALPSGSDRNLAALAEIDPQGRRDVVINLQGDMPFVAPEVLKACAALLEEQPSCDVATVVAPESGPADRTNPDVVKVQVENTAETIDIYKSLGIEYTDVTIYAYDQPYELYTFHRPEGLGERCQQLLLQAVEDAGVEIFTSTPAKELILDGGVVCGVVATDSDGNTLRIGAKAVVLRDGAIKGFMSGSCVQRSIRETAATVLQEGKPRLIRVKPRDEVVSAVDVDGTELHKSSCPSGGTVDIFIEPMRPAPRLVVCGASPVAIAVADLGRRLGYRIVAAALADDLAAFAEEDQRVTGFDLAVVGV